MAERKVITTNRKAFHDYSISDRYEAGIVLAGYEVKSLRTGESSLADGYVDIKNGEAYLENVHIAPYRMQSNHVQDYEPRRARKLLLHKNEIIKLFSKTREKGFTLVPLELYFSPRGTAKVSIGLGKGKTTYDKRDDLKKKDLKRELQKESRR